MVKFHPILVKKKKAKSIYPNRIRLERASEKQCSDTNKTPYDRVKRCRERKINIKAPERVNADVFTQNKRPSVRLPDSHLGGPGLFTIPVALGFSHMGIASDDAAGWRVFSGISRPPPHPSILTLASSALKARSLHTPLITTPRSHASKIDESEIHNRETPLVQHLYIGTKIKLDPGSKLRSFDLESGKMFLQPGLFWDLHTWITRQTLPSHGDAPVSSDWVRFPSGSLPDIRTWESYRTMPLVGGFSRGSPAPSRSCIPARLPAHFTLPSYSLDTSMLRAAQIAPLRFQRPLHVVTFKTWNYFPSVAVHLLCALCQLACESRVGWTTVGTPRPKSRSEGAIRSTLTRTPSASSLLRARHVKKSLSKAYSPPAESTAGRLRHLQTQSGKFRRKLEHQREIEGSDATANNNNDDEEG
ncbi:hypothetical protein PR048_030739 [Dryococelus australis]|uniref:Uncharacterized protein n=1 Tax=Dryococelus australis TaxID=614101 RepID=A0ABQ9G9S0_9NEOP|nr:hypothetical protein PR048_030739 [Dryococelus australis]